MRDNLVALHTSPGNIEWIHTKLDSPPPGWVFIKYLYCGICGGDYSIYLGRRKLNEPISLGHEFVGQIIELGDDVEGLNIGDFIVSDLNYRCGKCEYCRGDNSHLCLENAVGHFTNRGFASFANIHAAYLCKINPPGYLPRACLIEPLSCVLHACQNMSFTQDDRILICGGGGIGSLFCFYLSRVKNMKNIFVYEALPARQKLLKEHFGVEILQDNISGSYDWIIDSTNTVLGLQSSLNFAKQGARLCIMSHLYGLETSFIYETICKKELHCDFPLRNGKRENLIYAAQYIEQLWTEKDDAQLQIFNSIKEAFQMKEASRSCKQIVVAPTL